MSTKIDAGLLLAAYRADWEAIGVLASGTATTKANNALFSGYAAGGSGTVKGLVTLGTKNWVHIVDDADKQAVVDGTGNRVYGRLGIVETTNPAGTVSVTTDDAVVTGTGTNFLTTATAGQMFKASSHGEASWTEILSVDSDTQLTLVDGYKGNTGTGLAPRVGSWTVAFFSNPLGVATAYSFSIDTDLEIKALITDDIDDIAVISDLFDPAPVVASPGGSGISGSTGSTDNAMLRADGTGGSTVQASGVTLDDSQNMAALASVSMVEQASAPVVPGAGNGAFWVKQGTDVNLPVFTDENALDVELVRSITLSRSMPSISGDSVELGIFSPHSDGQSFSVFIFTGISNSNDFTAHHRVMVRTANFTSGFLIHQPLYTSVAISGLFGDLIQLEIDVALSGEISLRARSYIGIAQTVMFRLVLDGNDVGVFTPSSTQATTAVPTTNFSSSMLTMADAVDASSQGVGIIAWRPLYLQERAAADTDKAGFGQLWVQNTSPNLLVFTNDAGTDVVLGDLAAPSSSIDNSLARFNGTTGKLLFGGNASNNVILNDTGDLLPEVNDGGALGSGTFGWSDLFIASGGVINFVNGDVTITHFTNTLSFAGAASGYNFDAPLFLTERAAALANQSTKGQLWIKNETPSAIVYGDDTGVDANLLHYSPVKRPCRLATTGNIADLAAGAPNTVDGVAVVVGNRILVKDQSTGAQKGIYRVVTVGTGADGAWVRDKDWAVGGLCHIEAGVETYIQEGTQSGTRFTLSTTGAITVGTTAVTFV